MGLRDNGPDPVSGSVGSPTFSRLIFDIGIPELLIDRTFDQDARTTQAYLALVGKPRLDRGAHHILKFCIGKDEGWGSCPQLQESF